MSEAASPRGREPLFGSCWSCRTLSGGALIASGAFVFNEARKVMRRGGPMTVGTVAQITFALCIASWGIVFIADPMWKVEKKN